MTWYDAEKYIEGEYGDLSNEDGEFYLCYKEGDYSEDRYGTIATIDLQNRFCDEAGDPMHYMVPDIIYIAVASLPAFPQEGEVLDD